MRETEPLVPADRADPADRDVVVPPAGRPWETADPAALGWDPVALDAARDHARRHRTTGLVVVDRGRLVVEDNWPLGDVDELASVIRMEMLPDGRTVEDVASVQKSITSVLLGIAAGRGLLSLDDPITSSLGTGWSRASVGVERRITIRHLMSMTSGLDEHLRSLAEPGTRWHYNLGPAYHMLKRVLVAVADDDLDTLSSRWLFGPLGMTASAWSRRRLPDDAPAGLRAALMYPDGAPLEGLATTARDLARFGHAMLAGGRWADVDLGLAAGFLDEAWRPSSTLNPAYGLLWWVNGQSFRRTPSRPDPIDGPLLRAAPADTVAALGALGRAVFVVPSRGVVVVRIGRNPGDGPAAADRFAEELWRHLAAALPAA